ncbi:MAG: efflux RND transporter periplasmic adaptor subunit [Bacteroidia bacterium]
MKSIIAIVAFIIVLVVLRLTVFSGTEEGKPSAAGERPAIPVTAVITSTQALQQSIPSTGTLLAFESVDLMPETAGKIISLNINEGKRVNKGELLVKLNDEEQQANLRKIEVTIKLQEDKLSRQDQLFKIQGVSQEERDQTQQLLDAAKAEKAYYQALINKTEVRAPFSGVLGLKNVSEGAFVSTSTNICSLYKTEQLKLDFSIPERYSSMMKIPLVVTFNVQGNNREYSAEVFAIQPGVDQSTRSVRLRAKVENPGGELSPGRFAEVSVPLANNENAIMVPTQCIVPVLKGQQVWVSKNGQAKPVDVQVGFRNDKFIEVTSGLSPGDTVITSGIMSLRPGTGVRVSSFDSSSTK